MAGHMFLIISDRRRESWYAIRDPVPERKVEAIRKMAYFLMRVDRIDEALIPRRSKVACSPRKIGGDPRNFWYEMFSEI